MSHDRIVTATSVELLPVLDVMSLEDLGARPPSREGQAPLVPLDPAPGTQASAQLSPKCKITDMSFLSNTNA